MKIMIRTLQRVETENGPIFVLSDDHAIDLAHQFSLTMKISPAEAYQAIADGDAAFKGHRLVIQD